MSRARYFEEAEAEFLAEVVHYKEVQVQGADKFRAALEEATARALSFPRAGTPYLANTHRVFVKGYPFFLVYVLEPDGIAVVAVVHEARRPGVLVVARSLIRSSSRQCRSSPALDVDADE